MVIPAEGGFIEYTVHLESSLPDAYPHSLYSTYAVLPNGNEFGPTYSQEFTMIPFMNATVLGSPQYIPSTAPAGLYQFIGRLQYGGNIVQDGFEFTKQPGAGTNGDLWSGEGWISGEMAALGISNTENVVPQDYVLEAVYPNPFNAQARVTVRLPESSQLRIRVFNSTGQLVTELANEHLAAGQHEFTIDGADLASGLYFVQAEVPNALSDMKKIVLLK